MTRLDFRVFKTSLKSTIFLIGIFLMSSCGFHLRESLKIPADLGPVRVVSSDHYSLLRTSLEQSLERSGVVIAAPDAPADQIAVLDIQSEKWATSSVSVDQFGRSQEASLRYAVLFELRRANNAGLAVPKQVIEVSRDYVASPVDSLGQNSESELLSQELLREMAQSILRRIDAAARTDMVGSAPVDTIAE